MTKKDDADFFARADAHIDLANEQLQKASRGKVSAAFLYGASRFNAWVAACSCGSGDELRETRDEIVEYFLQQYRGKLVENLDDYIRNFDKYMKSGGEDAQQNDGTGGME